MPDNASTQEASSASTTPAIEARRLRKTYDGQQWAVDEVSFAVESGGFLALVGASGCGKTTTLKMLNRLVEPTDGQVLIHGEPHRQLDPFRLRRSIGYAFQGVGLFPHLSVYDNVAVVPRLLGWPADRIRGRFEHLMNMVHLEPDRYAAQRPDQLSGGQRQRVGFCRAIAAEPALLLMDEPFGALDPITRDALQQEFAQLQRDLKLTTVMVTHDMAEALLMADRVAVMNDGRLEQLDTPSALLARPASNYVAKLLETPKRQADRLEALARPKAEPESTENAS
jgi:osmoprotectant transport system ATP-binding protein